MGIILITIYTHTAILVLPISCSGKITRICGGSASTKVSQLLRKDRQHVWRERQHKSNPILKWTRETQARLKSMVLSKKEGGWLSLRLSHDGYNSDNNLYPYCYTSIANQSPAQKYPHTGTRETQAGLLSHDSILSYVMTQDVNKVMAQ